MKGKKWRFLFLFLFFFSAPDMRWTLTLWGMAISSILLFLALGMVLFAVDPEHATFFEWGLFVLALSLSVASICAFLILLFWRVFGGIERAMFRFGSSFRQGIFLSLFFVGSLFFKRNGWLTWWSASFLFAFFFLIELYFLWLFRLKKEKN